MYLNHPLVPGFPLTLRTGEERDREFLAGVFAEVWADIPEIDRTAILARGYGNITVDVVAKDATHGTAEIDGDIRLSREKIDHYPRNVVAAHIVARELAHKVDDFQHRNPAARVNEPREEAKRRVLLHPRSMGLPAASQTGEDPGRTKSGSRTYSQK